MVKLIVRVSRSLIEYSMAIILFAVILVYFKYVCYCYCADLEPSGVSTAIQSPAELPPIAQSIPYLVNCDFKLKII